MKQIHTLTILTIFILSINNINAQTVWTGLSTTFTKTNYTDWTLEANQDRMTNNVWLTRANKSGLFNIIKETESDNASAPANPAPTDTEWAYGTTANYASLTYENFSVLIGQNFSTIVDGQDIVLHLISDDIYIDIKFISWQSGNAPGGQGGGFSYERSTDQNLSTNEFNLNKSVKPFPNPSSDFIQVSGLTKSESYIIYTILVAEVQKGSISNQEKIDIRNLKNGFYFLKFKNGNTIKFIKE